MMGVTMANSAYRRKKFSVAKTTTGGPELVRRYPVKSGSTIEVGDPVFLDTDTVVLPDETHSFLLGVSLEDGVGADGDSVLVAVGDRNTIFMGMLNQAGTDYEDEITPCDIVVSGTDFQIDPDANTQDVLQLIGQVEGDDLTDTTNPPRFYFQILRSQWDSLVPIK
jgi:hypothetical protein